MTVTVVVSVYRVATPVAVPVLWGLGCCVLVTGSAGVGTGYLGGVEPSVVVVVIV